MVGGFFTLTFWFSFYNDLIINTVRQTIRTMKDSDVLIQSYRKYKNKKGRKALALKEKIKHLVAFERLMNDTL